MTSFARYALCLFLALLGLSFIVGQTFPGQGYLIGINGIVAGVALLWREPKPYPWQTLNGKPRK